MKSENELLDELLANEENCPCFYGGSCPDDCHTETEPFPNL